MIVRVFRAETDRSEEAIAYLRAAARKVPAQPHGLLGIVVGQELDDRGFAIITVWEDEEAMTATLGPDWDRADTPDHVLRELVDKSGVDNYRVVFGDLSALRGR